MKAPTLILKENSRTVITAEQPWTQSELLIPLEHRRVYLCTIKKKKSSLCELHVLCHLHENISGLLGSQYNMLIIHCTTVVMPKTTGVWNLPVLNALNQTEGKTALQQGYPLLVLLLSGRPKGQCLKLLFSILQQKTFPFDHHEGWGADLHNYPVNDGFYTYVYY